MAAEMSSPAKQVIGMMSGTSMDGLDIVCASFSQNGDGWEHQVAAAETIPYPPELAQLIDNTLSLSGLELTRADRRLGRYFGEQVQEFIERNRVHPGLIASHGHTVFHQPGQGITLQIGSGAEIHAVCGIPVICDFRSMDVALGGQGAPLVPAGDELLFGRYASCLNLGGFANISFRSKGKRIASDLAPCNLVLNRLAAKLGLPYDRDGNTARNGRVDQELLTRLSELPYYQKPFPKSLGREWLEKVFFPLLDAEEIAVEDKLATATEHIARETGRLIPPGTCLVTGGGAWNSFLVERAGYHTEGKLIVPDALTVNFKEALIFAFLGLLRAMGRNNVWKEVTGSSADHSGGAIWGNWVMR